VKNLALLLEESAARFPERPAIFIDGETITYGELDLKAGRIASGLKELGVQKGDRVGIHLSNCSEFVMAYFAILKAGATVVPINVMLKSPEIRYLLSDSGARFLFTAEELVPDVEPAIQDLPGFRTAIVIGSSGRHAAFGDLVGNQRSPMNAVDVDPHEDIAVIFYTSGTTGKPKGAMLTHGNMVFDAVASAQTFKYTPEDRVLSAMPLFHSAGQTIVITAPFSCGAAMVLLRRFVTERVFQSLKTEKPTVFVGVPTMFFQILNDPQADRFADNTLRLCLVGAAPIPKSIFDEFVREFEVEMSEGYGLSECSPVCAHNPVGGLKKSLSIGVPIIGVDMNIFDDDDRPLAPWEIGELVVRGANVMKGYLNRPKESAEALRSGWLHTGDMAYRDWDNYFFIVDRKKEMILTGGFNIYPREIEEILFAHEKVSEAAVVGIPDLEKGEKAKAFIVLKQGESATGRDIIEWCRERMAAYKVPRDVEFVLTLPRNAAGKVLKRVLRGEKE
jgi:long-chain acyl-CoA synthetase